MFSCQLTFSVGLSYLVLPEMVSVPMCKSQHIVYVFTLLTFTIIGLLPAMWWYGHKTRGIRWRVLFVCITATCVCFSAACCLQRSWQCWCSCVFLLWQLTFMGHDSVDVVTCFSSDSWCCPWVWVNSHLQRFWCCSCCYLFLPWQLTYYMGLSQFLPAEVVTMLMFLPFSPLTVDVLHGSESIPTCRCKTPGYQQRLSQRWYFYLFLPWQLTFSMGLSYLPLAQIGLEALEWWSESLPEEDIAPYYADILPSLDTYLKTSDKGRMLACTVQCCSFLSCLSTWKPQIKVGCLPALCSAAPFCLVFLPENLG